MKHLASRHRQSRKTLHPPYVAPHKIRSRAEPSMSFHIASSSAAPPYTPNTRALHRCGLCEVDRGRSPFLFNDFAVMLRDLAWTVTENEAVLNYLDDFFFGVEAAHLCLPTYQTFTDLCGRIGVPLAAEQCVAPTSRLDILDIMSTRTLRHIPRRRKKKLQDIVTSVASVMKAPKVNRRDLLSLVGRLGHECRCLPPGARAWLHVVAYRQLSVAHPLHRLRVTDAMWADLQVVVGGVRAAVDGTLPVPPTAAVLTLSTDSSRHGMGAVWDAKWWAAKWPEAVTADGDPSMTLLELLPILISAVIWDQRWSGTRVVVWYMSVVGA